jgi:hypothetical protein
LAGSRWSGNRQGERGGVLDSRARREEKKRKRRKMNVGDRSKNPACQLQNPKMDLEFESC